jgi:hypothetical protein
MWYYSINGGQEGPFDDARLNQLIAEGKVTAATFVWKDGMTDWTPLGQVRAPGIAVPAVADGAACSVCGKQVGSDNLIDLLGRRVCADCKPRAVQAIREGVAGIALNQGVAWQDGKKLVTRDEAALPARCCKCNAPATDQPLKRKLYWHPAGYYWLILLGVIIRIGILLYVIVAIIVRKRATIHVFLCPKHSRRRKILLIVGWTAFGVGLVGLMVGAATQMLWLTLLSPVLLIVSLVARIIGGRTLTASRIKDGVVWIRGAGKDFLASLPPWVG